MPDNAYAAFLDVDGTLLEIAPAPQAVHVPDSLKILLNELSSRLNGAMALISGRTVENLDALFTPHRYFAAGVHGCERRAATGEILHPEVDAEKLQQVRSFLGEFVRAHNGLLLEDKFYSLAVHFRLAPHLENEARERTRTALQLLGPSFEVQEGKCVLELRPANWNKGVSVAAFMQEAPFAGRRPIYIGDDVTDESAFARVNELGGVSVRVGPPAITQARYALRTVNEVHRWLEQLPPPAMNSLETVHD